MSTKREVHRILSTKSATRKLLKGENMLIYENVMLYEMISEWIISVCIFFKHVELIKYWVFGTNFKYPKECKIMGCR